MEHALTPESQPPAPGRASARYRDTHATGIESFVWLVHVDGLPCRDAAEMLCQTVRVILTNALATDPPAPVQKLRLQRRGDPT
jgi:hypothetical protein